jgi:hypothetical protein
MFHMALASTGARRGAPTGVPAPMRHKARCGSSMARESGRLGFVKKKMIEVSGTAAPLNTPAGVAGNSLAKED